MIRYIPLALLYLALALGGLASTPKRVGPTPSGYFFSIRVSETEIGQAYYPELEFDDDYPISAEFVVEVQNAQGQAVDDILVKFEDRPRTDGEHRHIPTTGHHARWNRPCRPPDNEPRHRALHGPRRPHPPGSGGRSRRSWAIIWRQVLREITEERHRVKLF